MGVDIRGTKKLVRNLAKTAAELRDKELLDTLGLVAKKRIAVRTDKGKDYQGRHFKGYSEKYKKTRAKRGRQTNVVDLQFERHMLNSMQVRSYPVSQEAKVFFSRATERKKAIYHSITGAGRRRVMRRFFALSTPDRRALIRQTDNFVKRKLK